MPVMTLLHPMEDFSKRTLASIAGGLPRMLYLSSLRGDDGEYLHWGMERIYGKPATSDAIAACHLQVLRDTLRTPLGELLAELLTIAGTAEVAESALADMRANLPKLIPPAAPRLMHAHFSSVLVSLGALIHAAPRDSTPQAA